MQLECNTRLQVLVGELQTRFFFILLSFGLSFLISYYWSQSLLYVFVLSFGSQSNTSTRGLSSGSEAPIDLMLGEMSLSSVDLNKDDSVKTLQFQELGVQHSSFINKVQQELPSIDFIFTGVEEGFSTIIAISFAFSLISAIPILIYQVFSFLSSSLYFYESKKWNFTCFLICFFWCGFSYNVLTYLIPKLAEFLLCFEISSLAFTLSAKTKISSYCSWASQILIAANFIFFCSCWLFLTSWKTHFNRVQQDIYNSNNSKNCKIPHSQIDPLLTQLPYKAVLCLKNTGILRSCSFLLGTTENLTIRRIVRVAIKQKGLFRVRTLKPSSYCSPFCEDGTITTYTFQSIKNKLQLKISPHQMLNRRTNIEQSIKNFQKKKLNAVISVLVSAFIAPPDVTQIILAVFLFCIFEIAIFFSKITSLVALCFLASP